MADTNGSNPLCYEFESHILHYAALMEWNTCCTKTADFVSSNLTGGTYIKRKEITIMRHYICSAKFNLVNRLPLTKDMWFVKVEQIIHSDNTC